MLLRRHYRREGGYRSNLNLAGMPDSALLYPSILPDHDSQSASRHEHPASHFLAALRGRDIVCLRWGSFAGEREASSVVGAGPWGSIRADVRGRGGLL